MSNINPQNIDGTYPIAGQDNNSQGFRDNFTNTVNNFTFAAAELTDLQNNALLKAPLGSVGQSGTPTNNMNYAYLTAPQLIQTVETINNLGTITNGGNVTVDWTTGHYQTVSLAGSATLAFASTWPGSVTNPLYTELIVQANVQVAGSGLTLPSAVVNNLADIAGASGQTITFPTAGLYQYKFSTSDGGATITIRDLINNYQTTIGNVNVIGNLITNGGRIEAGYQYLAPTGNVVFTANTNVSRIILDPAGAGLVSLYANITLPAGNVDAKVVAISSTQTVQFLSIQPSFGASLAPYGNITLTGGTQVQYFYHAVESKWYKIA